MSIRFQNKRYLIIFGHTSKATKCLSTFLFTHLEHKHVLRVRFFVAYCFYADELHSKEISK